MNDRRRTSTEVDRELQAERATIKKLQAKLKDAAAEVKKAEQEQDRAAYKALAQDDAAAQRRLEEAEEKQSRAARRAKSYEMAIAQAMQRFEQLEAEWKRALNLEALEKLKVLARERIKLAPRLDTALAEIVAVNTEFQRITRDMLQIKQSLSLRDKLHEDNLREYLRAALYPSFGEFTVTKTFKVYREQKDMAALENLCFEHLLAMEDLPGGEPEPGDGPDPEAAQPEAGAA